jgi:tetratricopeptide (TPR) repeat protein
VIRRTPTRLRVFAAASLLAAACATTTDSSPKSFARVEAKGRRLLEAKRWDEALSVSQAALAECDRTEWCARDNRYQGLFHTQIGQAQENLGRPERALDHYRKAFNAYPLFFTENYFRMLRDAGMYRILRQEIDAKLASNEAAYRSAAAFWLSPQTAACGGRAVSGNYSWTLKAPGVKGPISGKAVFTQTGCVASADIALPAEKGAGGLLHFRGDIHAASVNLLFGPPCLSTDKGRIQMTQGGFTVNADRAAAAQEGCFHGPYVMEFMKN